MNVVILGGTRFIGRRIASELLRGGASVTVVSRTPKGAPPGVDLIVSDRRVFLQEGEAAGHLAKAHFIIDMTAYSEGDVHLAMRRFPNSAYFLTSTTWLPQKSGASDASQPISKAPKWARGLPGVTRSYLAGKLACERDVFERRAAGAPAYILRLPIVLGSGDHTGRSGFYLSRALDGCGQILVDGGLNSVQVVGDRDVALAFVRYLKQGLVGSLPVLEALPLDSISVHEIALIAARVAKVRFIPVHADNSELHKEAPGYLDAEPLWREELLSVSHENLFALAGHDPCNSSVLQETLMRELLDSNKSLRPRLPDEVGYLCAKFT